MSRVGSDAEGGSEEVDAKPISRWAVSLLLIF